MCAVFNSREGNCHWAAAGRATSHARLRVSLLYESRFFGSEILRRSGAVKHDKHVVQLMNTDTARAMDPDDYINSQYRIVPYLVCRS